MRYTILAGLLLAGCGAIPASKPIVATPAVGPDTCNAAAYQGLVGMDAASSLALPEPKRVYGVTDAVTTDFIPTRLNVRLDDTDTIISVTCG